MDIKKSEGFIGQIEDQTGIVERTPAEKKLISDITRPLETKSQRHDETEEDLKRKFTERWGEVRQKIVNSQVAGIEQPPTQSEKVEPTKTALPLPKMQMPDLNKAGEDAHLQAAEIEDLIANAKEK